MNELIENIKDREIFSDLKVIPPFAVRIDGRGFKKNLKRLQMEKPYDIRFAKAMADAAELFFKDSGFNPVLAFIFSDEITFLFLDRPFKGRVEKIDSVIPSFISSAITILLKSDTVLSFDSRIVPLGREDIYKYLLWRQAETWRNHLNSYAFYMLRRSGLSERDAASELKNLKSTEIHELVFRHGINLGTTPVWQRCGVLVYKDTYQKQGYDPVMKKEVTVTRTRIKQDWEPPIFKSKEGSELIWKITGSSLPAEHSSSYLL